MITTAPPIPKDQAEHDRWQHTRLRRRMLYGAWERDLNERLRKQIGNVRREAWGSPDLSSNVFRSVVSQLAVLYDRWPTIGHDDGAAELTAAVEAGGLWPLMQRLQRDCLGLREMLCRVDIADDGGLTFRPVFPDLVIANSHADRPSEPVMIKEARQRTDPHTGKVAWYWDVTDITDPTAPSFKVLDQAGNDLTELYTGTANLSGEAYPYRKSNGEPFVPYAIYHASESGTLWDSYEASELVEGSLTCAVLWSMFSHSVRSASWPQRYAIGVELPSAAYTDEDGDGTGRSEIVTDPATVLMLRQSEDMAGQAMVGQWAAGADPEQLQRSIVAFERRVAAYAGLSGSDILRQSGDPRSGYAISVSRAAQREAQRRWEPMFRAGDLRLLTICAALLNRAHGSTLPESGYRIGYEGVPLSAEEKRGQRDHISAMLSLGLMDKIDAYQMLHAGISRPDALKALAGIATFDADLEALLTQDAVVTTGAPPASTGAGKAQDTALNGAQVTAAQGIVVAVAAGELPRGTGVAMLTNFFNMSPAKAEAIMGDVGKGFTVSTNE